MPSHARKSCSGIDTCCRVLPTANIRPSCFSLLFLSPIRLFSMMLRVCSILLLVVGITPVRVVMAAEMTPPRVPGFERFYTGPLMTLDEEVIPVEAVTGGRLLLGELNCLSCHDAANEIKHVVSTKQAPILDEIGSRARVAWLREYLAKPHSIKPGTTMPDVIAALPEAERAGAVEALVHFLATTGTVTESHPDRGAAKKGGDTFRKVGCVACHAPSGDKPDDVKLASLATTIPLPDISKKYSVPSLMAFLKDPLKVRPSGRMPALGLKDEEYRDIAQHFIDAVELAPNVKFAAFEVAGNDFPNYDALTPKSTGTCAGFDLTVAGRENNFAMRFTTFLHITKPGQYQIHLGSDDGSRAYVGKDLIVDNGGVRPHTFKSGKVILDVGFHPLTVDYFQGGGEWTLDVDLSGNGIKQQPLANFASLEAKEPETRPTAGPESKQAAFAVDASLAEKGRTLFGSLGCASCHQLKVDGKQVASMLKAKPFGELSGASGCLAENVASNGVANVPRFGLSAKQRESLVAVIASLKSDTGTKEAPAEKIHRTLASLNCYACHKRGQLGGVEKERDAFFETTQKEMGDEGRLPPFLTGVGDKLRPEFLKHVLNNGGDDRKIYMLAKMPKFGGGNINLLAEELTALDAKHDPLPKVAFAEPGYRVKAAGRHLVGGQALSCIKCHDFNEHPSTGIRAINLTRMHARLRPEWVDRYLRDPQLYRPGTRMPAPWPFGKTTIRDVLDANVDQQIAAVWMYLGDGGKAAVPVGLVREPIELKPTDSPIVYRNFIEGAGSRAIGVGYPQKVNLAWDANEMRLALVWHGAFIDASRHWTGRGVGYEAPLGDHLIELAPNAPLAKLASPNDPWPTMAARDSGFRFLGYKLDSKQQPTFRYSFAGVTVEDQPVPLKADGQPFAGLRRTLTFTGNSDGPLYYRTAVANKIEKVAEGEYRVDGFWTMKLTAPKPSADEDPWLRQAGNKWELLVPVKGPMTITQDYVW